MKYKLVFPDGYKRYFTLDDLEACKRMQSSKLGFDDRINFDSEVDSVLSLVDGSAWGFEVFDVTCEYAKNAHVHNYYDDASGNMDIWLTIKAFNSCRGFYVIGVYLSDIWSIPNDYNDPMRDEIKSRMYVRRFVEK